MDGTPFGSGSQSLQTRNVKSGQIADSVPVTSGPGINLCPRGQRLIIAVVLLLWTGEFKSLDGNYLGMAGYGDVYALKGVWGLGTKGKPDRRDQYRGQIDKPQ